jgi:Na+/proline symporter
LFVALFIWGCALIVVGLAVVAFARPIAERMRSGVSRSLGEYAGSRYSPFTMRMIAIVMIAIGIYFVISSLF